MFQKVDFLKILEKSPFTRSCTFAGIQYRVCNATKNEFLAKFLKCALKLTENFQEVISTEVAYQKFTDLQTAVLRVFKAPKVVSMVEFLSSEAGANGFSTE